MLTYGKWGQLLVTSVLSRCIVYSIYYNSTLLTLVGEGRGAVEADCLTVRWWERTRDVRLLVSYMSGIYTSNQSTMTVTAIQCDVATDGHHGMTHQVMC